MEFYGPEIHESMYFLFFTWGYSLLNPSIPMLVEWSQRGKEKGLPGVIKPRFWRKPVHMGFPKIEKTL